MRTRYPLARSLWMLRGLKRGADACLDRPEELVSLVFEFAGSKIKPLQIKEELASLVKEVRRVNPSTVLEIGTARGGTLFLWTRLARPDAAIMSIDLPGGKFGNGYSRRREFLYRRFAGKSQRLHLLRGDSHSPDTMSEARKFFEGQPLDFLFIDGDHTYEGVKKDWEMYSPLVRAGGVIAFHDIAEHPPSTGCEVARFWNQIKTLHRHLEIIENPKQGWAGVGVLIK